MVGTKMTNTGPFLWNGSSKIKFFCDMYLISFLSEAVELAYITFFKTGCKYQNVITSGICRTHFIHKIVNPDHSSSRWLAGEKKSSSYNHKTTIWVSH